MNTLARPNVLANPNNWKFTDGLKLKLNDSCWVDWPMLCFHTCHWFVVISIIYNYRELEGTFKQTLSVIVFQLHYNLFHNVIMSVAVAAPPL